MDKLQIYESISKRTQGDIYIGVVGPVRTGKSTFIKRFMDLLVVPHVENEYVRERIKDELPQSGGGKTIMTTEPKFVPAEAVELTLAQDVSCRVRLIDCVGYMVEGAMGHWEDGKPRMVSTPWSQEPMPFEEAAETGTRKVIADHCTIGLVVTTDGSVSEIDRENYRPGEARVIQELQQLGKPFIVVLNCVLPDSQQARECKKEIQERYGAPVVAVNCARMDMETLNSLLEQVLYEFPLSQMVFHMPGFVGGLEEDHWIRLHINTLLRQWADSFTTIRKAREGAQMMEDGRVIKRACPEAVELSCGRVDVDVDMAGGLFYQVLGEMIDAKVENDRDFFRLIRQMAKDQRAYDKLKGALAQTEALNYGIVEPDVEDMCLQEPSLFRQGSKYGVRIRATAPSLHLIRTQLSTEVAPVVGEEEQAKDLLRHLQASYEAQPQAIWEVNLLGKTLREMVAEQMQVKAKAMPEQLQFKIQHSIQKISDEGKDYFICIIL